MFALMIFLIMPCLFLAICVVLMRKWQWHYASVYGLLAFGLSFILGGVEIFEIRSSTAGIGFVFLPAVSLVPGVIAFVLGRVHTSYLQQKKNNNLATIQRIGLIICSSLITTFFIWQASQLVGTIPENTARDLNAEDLQRNGT